MTTEQILIERTARIGVRTVSRIEDRYFVAIRNRSYHSKHEVSIEIARNHYRAIRNERQR